MIDADDLARAVCAPHSPIVAAIREEIGTDVVTPAGALDRRALARRIFADPAARQRLEALTHPAILTALRARIAAWQSRARPDAVLVVVLPLLYEAGVDGLVDRVLVTDAPDETLIARVQARDGLTDAEARQRLAAQWPAAEKAARADYVVDTTGALDETRARVRALWPALVAASATAAAGAGKA